MPTSILSSPFLPGLPSLNQVKAELSKRRLHEFIRQAWPIVEPGVEFVDGWHIGAICEHLQAITSGQIQNLLINMPPRHMKSVAVSVMWPAWEWISFPFRRWLFASYAQKLSTRDSVACRRLIESPWYRANWPHVQLVGDQNEKTRYETADRGVRIATSTTGTGTGEGGNRVVCDDPHSVSDSQEVIASTVEWWSQVMSTRLNDPKRDAKVIVMQRVNERDLSGYVLDQGGWEHLMLPAEYEPKRSKVTVLGWSDPRTEDDELLWPERFGRKELDALKKELGSLGAAGQLQQRPAPAGGALLKRSWWRYWTQATLPPSFDTQLISVDCAFKGTSDADYVVFQAWGRRGADRYLLDQVRKKLDFPGTVKEFVSFCSRWPDAATKIVEAKANGQAVIDSLRQRIPGLIGENPHESKEARVSAVSPEIESGNVYVPQNAGWVDEFLAECDAFPMAPMTTKLTA